RRWGRRRSCLVVRSRIDRHARAGRAVWRQAACRAQSRGRILGPRPPAARARTLMAIRVLIVDDQALVRAGFRMILEAQPDLEVVGESGDGQSAIDAADRWAP